MEKMNVITFKETGHVLGALTRASQPEKAASVEDIAVGGFRLYNRWTDPITTTETDIIIEIPEDKIGVALVDYETLVLYRPHLFVQDLKDKTLDDVSGNPVPVITLSSSSDQITVTLPDSVNEPTDVWCQITGSNLSKPIVKSVRLPGTATTPVTTETAELILSDGDYHVAMFAPGYALAIFKVTAT